MQFHQTMMGDKKKGKEEEEEEEKEVEENNNPSSSNDFKAIYWVEKGSHGKPGAVRMRDGGELEDSSRLVAGVDGFVVAEWADGMRWTSEIPNLQMPGSHPPPKAKAKAKSKDKGKGNNTTMKVMKTPAAAKAKAKATTSSPAPPPGGRELLINGGLTRGAYTSRAYDRTRRQALKQGKTKDKAKEIARAEFAKAAAYYDKHFR